MGFLKANFQKEGKGISKDTPEKTGFALFIETLIRELVSLIKLNLKIRYNNRSLSML